MVREVYYTDGLGTAKAYVFNTKEEMVKHCGYNADKLVESQRLWVQDIYSNETIGKCQEYYIHENSKTRFYLVKIQ